jgi:quinoprotein glucose dehydrogenase
MLQTEGHLVGTPDSGAVFRCNPDGTGMEMVYVGLRNPQELVFDEWGNLFTGDNNSDGGDQARWTYLIEGGDSGWRIGWQFLEKPNPRGPWNSEKMWMPQNDAQPAYITPPIKNITAGPSGNAYYPGTGLGPEWQGTFTLCDFRGSGSGSGIVSFKLKPRGASFEIVDDKKFVWSIEATDGAWGPDGAFWISDWVDGWEPVGKGRIYRFYDTNTIHQPIVKSTRELLASDFATKSDKTLLDLLAHPNFRVRQAAQFTLAERGEGVSSKLIKVVRGNGDLHARLHSLWALGQIQAAAHKPGRVAKSAELDAIVPLLGDKEAHLRANAARVLGDAR